MNEACQKTPDYRYRQGPSSGNGTVCKIYLNFDWQTSSPSLDILNSRLTFCCKMSNKYQTFRWTSIHQT